MFNRLSSVTFQNNSPLLLFSYCALYASIKNILTQKISKYFFYSFSIVYYKIRLKLVQKEADIARTIVMSFITFNLYDTLKKSKHNLYIYIYRTCDT